MTLETLAIPNARCIAPGVWASGQPALEQLAQLSAAGVRTLINLCAEGECGWNERHAAQAAGLTYVAIPVRGAVDLSPAAARALHEALERAERPVLVHCGTSNRVGALFALRARIVEGQPAEAALEQGRAAGLKGLEPVVRQILETHS